MLPDQVTHAARFQTAGLAQRAELNLRDHVTARASSVVGLASAQVL